MKIHTKVSKVNKETQTVVLEKLNSQIFQSLLYFLGIMYAVGGICFTGRKYWKTLEE